MKYIVLLNCVFCILYLTHYVSNDVKMGLCDFVCDVGGTYDVHKSLQNGRTALMWASQRGHLECVKKLLDRGAQVNVQDEVSAV